MAGKKLGRGLKFLLSDKAQGEEPIGGFDGITGNLKENKSRVETTLIPLEKIRSNPYQPRQHWGREDLAELANSIKENGVLQPILARKLGDEYQIIAGERRVRAARMAGKLTISAIIRDVGEDEMHTLALIENIQREDLNPIEKAKSFLSLKKKTGWSQEKLSQSLGLKRSTLTNYLRLLELPPKALACLESGEISMGHARAILAAPSSKQNALLGDVISQHLSVRETESRAKALNNKKKESEGKKDKARRPAWIVEWEEILKQTIGCPVKITYNSGKSKLSFDIPSKDEMTRILHLLATVGTHSPTEEELIRKKVSRKIDNSLKD